MTRYRGWREQMTELMEARAAELGASSEVPVDRLVVMFFAMAKGVAITRMLEPEAADDALFGDMMALAVRGALSCGGKSRATRMRPWRTRSGRSSTMKWPQPGRAQAVVVGPGRLLGGHRGVQCGVVLAPRGRGSGRSGAGVSGRGPATASRAAARSVRVAGGAGVVGLAERPA